MCAARDIHHERHTRIRHPKRKYPGGVFLVEARPGTAMFLLDRFMTTKAKPLSKRSKQYLQPFVIANLPPQVSCRRNVHGYRESTRGKDRLTLGRNHPIHPSKASHASKPWRHPSRVSQAFAANHPTQALDQSKHTSEVSGVFITMLSGKNHVGFALW